MYDFIEGELVRYSEQAVVIETGGIGFSINPSRSALDGLPGLGEKAKLYVHQEVKEDDVSLYGFADREERKLFREAISVSRIGPKTGLQILSSMDDKEFRRAIMDEEEATLTSVKGIGKKTARRLILELGDKISDLEVSSDRSGTGGKSEVALRALTSDSMGFSPGPAREAISEVRKNNSELTVQQLIQKALKELS